jgi:L-seryl-tRNA(Ser) seleniumtransferase
VTDKASDPALDDQHRALRSLAAVDEVLRVPAVAALASEYPRELVVRAVRAVVDRLRREILEEGRAAEAEGLSAEALAPWVEALVKHAVSPSLRTVINATGIVAHTNLGRSPLPAEAVQAVARAAASYSDLEFDLASGERSSRQVHVRDALTTLTGAEDALVVNNNAAAVLLALAAVARGGEVLVSRGQLVEIGDGFRIPDILAESGAALVEVGTTNRTYLRDFERAAGERSRAVLRVHTSNYRIVGFTSEPTVDELAAFAHARGLPLVDDLGSGALAPLDLFAGEPSIAASLAAGADVVTFSGDKMLGGPQAGIAVGTAATIDLMRRQPLARAVRIDKLGIAALDAVLRLYLAGDQVLTRVPTLAMLAAPLGVVRARAETLRAALLCEGGGLAEDGVEIVESVARAGAGALPIEDVPSIAVVVTPPVSGAARPLPSAACTTVVCCSICVPCATRRSRRSPLRCSRRCDDRRAAAHAGHRWSHRSRQDGAHHPPHRQEHRPATRGARARHKHRAGLR